MNTGLVLGIASIILALILNYVNLYTFKDFSDGSKEGKPAKHWLISYFASWPIALIPFAGLMFEGAWLANLMAVERYQCPLFKEV